MHPFLEDPLKDYAKWFLLLRLSGQNFARISLSPMLAT
jgi:hypothetical protein